MLAVALSTWGRLRISSSASALKMCSPPIPYRSGFALDRSLVYACLQGISSNSVNPGTLMCRLEAYWPSCGIHNMIPTAGSRVRPSSMCPDCSPPRLHHGLRVERSYRNSYTVLIVSVAVDRTLSLMLPAKFRQVTPDP